MTNNSTSCISFKRWRNSKSYKEKIRDLERDVAHCGARRSRPKGLSDDRDWTTLREVSEFSKIQPCESREEVKKLYPYHKDDALDSVNATSSGEPPDGLNAGDTECSFCADPHGFATMSTRTKQRRALNLRKFPRTPSGIPAYFRFVSRGDVQISFTQKVLEQALLKILPLLPKNIVQDLNTTL